MFVMKTLYVRARYPFWLTMMTRFSRSAAAVGKMWCCWYLR